MNQICCTLDEMIKCVGREISLRERLYPSFVEKGKLSQKQAGHELACMRDVLNFLHGVKQLQEAKEDFVLTPTGIRQIIQGGQHGN